MATLHHDGRVDLYVPNEADVLVVTSAERLDGRRPPLAEAGAELTELARSGAGALLGLEDDEPVVVRVVLGAPTPQEDEEWVGRLELPLDLPDGRLALASGRGFLRGDYDEELVRFVEVPSGRYRVSIEAQLVGINGEACLERAGDLGADEPGEPLGAYFRRTRPGAEVPEWLQVHCAQFPHLDPGHEEEWEDFAESDRFAALEEEAERTGLGFVDLLLRLEPVAELPELHATFEEDGVLREAEVRKPARCPLGLRATGLWS